MALNRSQLTAIILFGVVIAFFLVGRLFGAGGDSSIGEAAEQTRVEVIARTVRAQPRPAILSLRGRTEAFREVMVRAETAGRVAETLVAEGARVEAGDVLCRLDVDARTAALAQAEANLRAAQLDYDSAVELAGRGHRSTNQVAATEAARDAARAQHEAARIELSNINIVAPFPGVFDQRVAEIGDFLGPGDPCGLVAQLDPIKIIAEVAERDVAALAAGMPGEARLVSGETIRGEVFFVEQRADPATRTFRVEMIAENPEGGIRAGVTSDLAIPLDSEPAHRIPTSILSLNAAGELGVRIVEDGERVRFVPVRLLSDDGEQVWVAGLPNPARVIILGQDFVADGAEVEVREEERETASR